MTSGLSSAADSAWPREWTAGRASRYCWTVTNPPEHESTAMDVGVAWGTRNEDTVALYAKNVLNYVALSECVPREQHHGACGW